MIDRAGLWALVPGLAVLLRLSRPEQRPALARLHCAASESLSRRVEQWK
jgi:hypothetical protein